MDMILRTLVSVLLLAPLQLMAAEDCKPSEWGADDQMGAANRITPASIKKASRLIKTGKTYSLGITIDSDTPAFAPRASLPHGGSAEPAGSKPPDGRHDLQRRHFSLVGWASGRRSTASAMPGHKGVYYNCNEAKDFASVSGLTKLGIENVPPIVARGIVLDMAGHYGVSHLEAGQYFTVDDVKAVAKKQGTPIREGDVVLFHTGWTDAKLKSDPVAWVSGEPGQSEEVALYMASKKVVAVGADTWGVDVVPPQVATRPYQGHITYLKENGIYMFETMNTGPLVRDEAFEFLFVLGQAKVKGAVQMLINPTAIR